MPSVREALPAGDVPPPSAPCAMPPSGPRRFGVAILAVGVMVGVRIVLNPLLGHHSPASRLICTSSPARRSFLPIPFVCTRSS